ncbi:PREDICTED: probable protein phosphatase 2C 65 [Fragaria vesca subsp. vesca]|uniref:probable protein phosphatase 2C 65 n=1 Tax=Fragaria vesca subsp. vesca TaxID=101020 RepID=UPI0002C375FD|nr:PREDICTED: probable protein phosphatase 2C 65 [Fragaria vesca subsp. vesca]
MGGCCTKDALYNGNNIDDERYCKDDTEFDGDDDMNNVKYGEDGARIRMQGSSRYISMYTQQGKKGINQDAMTVWEDFAEKDMYYCGVFDGHGPDGHKIARYVRDNLPSKLSQVVKIYQLNTGIFDNASLPSSFFNQESNTTPISKGSQDISLSSWEASFVKSFKDMDEELSLDSTIDSFCSGSTAVNVVKQGDHLVIANLGDSRAVLGTRGENNQIVPVQLTVDLKPDTPSEAERIKKCNGRIFAVDEEPEVYRIWMPDEDCPGLAMARAFGDFCLKDYGLISIPEVCYKTITSDDEFVVLATDGVWDALSNANVVKIVASAKKRSNAAKLLVKRAVRAWKRKYPESKIDDCAVICLFLKDQPSLSRSMSHGSRGKVNEPALVSYYSTKSNAPTDGGGTELSLVNSKISEDTKEGWSELDGSTRVNSLLNVPRYDNALSWRKKSKDFEEVEAH